LDERQRAMERAIEARFEDERARHNARDQADLAQRGAG